jgi:hypothetical protein
MRYASFVAILAFASAFATNGAAASASDRSSQSRAAERAYLRTVSPLTANDVTSNLRGLVGKHVAFVCEIVAIVDRGTMIGQCGKEIEPVDLYVHMPTTGTKTGERFRVIGEMETPSMWVDVSGHPWYTGFVKAHFVDRL